MNIVLDSAAYVKWKEESGLRPGSISTYKAGLGRFGEFIVQKGFDAAKPLDFSMFYHSKKTGEFYPIDVGFIDEFICSLVKEGKTPSSIRSTIDGLKSFFQFQYNVGMFDRDLLRTYPNRFYMPTLQDKMLTYEEATALLGVARVLTYSSGEDYYLLILLLLTCGLRAQEVWSCREDQIRWEDHTIVVNRGQKTNARPVCMSKDLEEELKLLLKQDKWVKRKCRDSNPHIFYYNGAPLNRYRLVQMIDTVVQATDPALSVTPHTFRYTMAGLLCDHGVNVSTIQRQMRHERLTTTLHYLGVDARAAAHIAEENARRLMPRFSDMFEQLKYLAGNLQ